MLRTTARTSLVSAGLAGLAGLALAAPAEAGPGPHVAGELIAYSSAVPEDARARVHSVETGDGRTIMTLHVKGLQPFTEYGAHAHVNACSPTSGLAAGPHFQHVVDPVSPSTNPAYANPDNEIWLDLTTNASGIGSAKAVVDWQFSSERRARSVILHQEHTATGPGEAGMAGARLACLSVPF
jgi:Cu-Zn family superoxide dismutase